MQMGTAALGVDEYTDVVALFEQIRDQGAESTRAARHRELIFTRCLVLADRVARHYGGRGQDVEDLTQVARLGLVKAVNRFDPAKGSNFVAFAIPTMMGEVRRHFRDTGWCTHVPRRIKDRSTTIIAATAALTQTLGQAPTAAQLAEHLDLSREEVIESLLAAQAYQVDSIDAPVSAGEAAPRLLSETVGELDTGFALITDRESI
jgi:RNA polymerase sigma-B factor